MKLNICLASDDNYAKHMAVTICSVLKNAQKTDELFFYILDGGISDNTKSKISEMKKIKDFSIQYYRIDSDMFKNCTIFGQYISIVTYYRFIIASVLPTDVDKVLYLDSDVIINKSLAELFNEDIENYYFAGVQDIGYYYWRYKKTDEFYVNAGILLLNLKKWRNDNFEKKLFDFIEINKDIELRGCDQDVLNFVAEDKIKPLNLKWNVQDSFYRKDERDWHPLKKDIEKAVKNPAAVHFTSQKKPWDDCLMPMAHLYTKYIKYTEFEGKFSETEVFIKNLFYKIKNLIKYPMDFIKNKKNLLPRYLAYKLPHDFYLDKKNLLKQYSNMENYKHDKLLEILKEKGFQKKLNAKIKKYKNKKAIIYGTGMICDIIFDNFDLSGLDIVFVSDKKYKDNAENYKGIPAIVPEQISEKKPDIVLTTLQDLAIAEDYFQNNLFPKYGKFKYESFFI